jgi:hypothetical protein
MDLVLDLNTAVVDSDGYYDFLIKFANAPDLAIGNSKVYFSGYIRIGAELAQLGTLIIEVVEPEEPEEPSPVWWGKNLNLVDVKVKEPPDPAPDPDDPPPENSFHAAIGIDDEREYTVRAVYIEGYEVEVYVPFGIDGRPYYDIDVKSEETYNDPALLDGDPNKYCVKRIITITVKLIGDPPYDNPDNPEPYEPYYWDCFGTTPPEPPEPPVDDDGGGD